jgi:DNA polymerase III epsilon subunit-like protein
MDNYKVISQFGDYIEKGSKIVMYEMDSEFRYDNYPIRVTKKDGTLTIFHCSYDFTESIWESFDLVKQIIHYYVIDQDGEILISNLKPNKSNLDEFDFEIEIVSSETSFELMRRSEVESKKRKEEEIRKDREYEKKVKTQLEIFANHYYNLNLNITSISNQLNEHNFYCRNILKSPNHKWKHLFTSRQTKDEYRNHSWENATGIGTVTGYDYLRVLDLDGCTDYNFLDDVLKILKLPSDYEWIVKSGSNSGFHIYFKCEKYEWLSEEQVVTTFPPLSKFKKHVDKVEILWNTHVVLPPSLHNSGGNYSFINCKYPKSSPSTIDISGISNFINKYLEVEKKSIGRGYGEVIFEFIPPNLPSNIEVEDKIIQSNKDIICVIDIETDGLPEKKFIIGSNEPWFKFPNIIQIAWVLMDVDGTVYKKSSELVNFPGIQRTNAFDINQLSIELIKQIGSQPSDVYKKLNNDIRYSKYVVCHNVDFDIPIIKSELKKYNIQNLLDSKSYICTMKESTIYCDLYDSYGKRKYPKLKELYFKLFGYEIEQNHNAESDVLLTAKCLKELLNLNIINLK